MGRLISPSKPSAPQQVVYVPAPAASTPAPATETPATETPPTEAEVSTQRAEGLLRRNRSRLGTVLTSFRGVLDQNTLAAPRKTLLGE